MTILSDNLKKARKHHDMIQERAAKLIGVRRSLLAAWEEGRSKPTITLLPKIIEAYEIKGWIDFLTKEHWNPALDFPSSTPSLTPSTIEQRYRRLRGPLKNIADILLK